MYTDKEIERKLKYKSERYWLIQDIAKGYVKNLEYYFIVLDQAEDEEEKKSLLVNSHQDIFDKVVENQDKSFFMKIYNLMVDSYESWGYDTRFLPRDINYFYRNKEHNFPTEWGYEIIDCLLHKLNEFEKYKHDYYSVLNLFRNRMGNNFVIDKAWAQRLVKKRGEFDQNERYYLEKFLTRGLVNEEIKKDLNKLNQIKQAIEECKNCGYYNNKYSSKCELCDSQYPRKCKQCGSDVNPENNFCPNCGIKI